MSIIKNKSNSYFLWRWPTSIMGF